MLNPIRIDHNTQQIIMTNDFFKKACNPQTDEYEILQKVRRDYPNYTEGRHTIAKAANKESYNGLTYSYMEDYILSHESDETVKSVLAEFEEMRLISKCHSHAFRYPTIKKWFLNRYPEIRKFGLIIGNAKIAPAPESYPTASSF